MCKNPIKCNNLQIMRRVFGVLLFWPLFCFSQQGQYEDTIQGRINVNYNQPLKMKVSLLAGGAFEIQGLEGGVMLPSAFADLHFRPSKWVMFHGAVTNQFQLGWQFQKVIDTRTLEVGARVFLGRRTIDKIKTFTAGEGAWNYDFHFPVKVLWNLGITGSYRLGRGVFNTGLDPNTSIRFENLETHKVSFLEQVAVPYAFSEYAVGFVLNTSTNMKVTAILPSSQRKSRRMKTFTEFRVELIYAKMNEVAKEISIKSESNGYPNQNFLVIVKDKSNLGYRISGFFRRKLIGFKVEAGAKPGINYRFSGAEKKSILNRTYMQFGIGFGWM